MKISKTFAVISIVALLLVACGPASTAAPIVTPGMTPLPSLPRFVGKISAEEKLVETGSNDQLEPVKEVVDFFDNDTVRVTNGGVAKLDLFTDQINNQISIMIFNDTAVSNVKTDPSRTTDPFVTLLLVFGGLTGEVPKNGGIPAKFITPNGVTIYILGTQFLVLYDPEVDTTYIGNFDGVIAYSIPGQSVQFTQAGQLYEISSNFEINQTTLNFTRADIEDRTSRNRVRLLDSLNEYLIPTATPTPSSAFTPTITATPMSFPAITPMPTRIPCDRAAFVTDVTISDGTSLTPGFQFNKVWRIRNVGSCTWTSGYSLVFSRGEHMSGPASVNIPSTVAPGQTVDVSVGLVAPALPGSYRGNWMLRSSSGALFGVGSNGITPIWVTINVINPTTTTPAGLPDLTATINSTPTEECTIFDTCNLTIAFAVTNTGPVAVTRSFQVLIEANELQSITITVNGLAAGASQNFSQTLAGLGVSCFNPNCTARVTVDSSNTILEANENNNVAATTILRGTITGKVYSDNNNNNIPDEGEFLSDITVNLKYNTDTDPIATRVTGANGVYTFADLDAGSYIVEWIGGCSPGNANPIPVDLIAGDTLIRNINTDVIC